MASNEAQRVLQSNNGTTYMVSYVAHCELQGPQRATRPTACYKAHEVTKLQSTRQVTKPTACSETHSKLLDTQRVIIYWAHDDSRTWPQALKPMKWQRYEVHSNSYVLHRPTRCMTARLTATESTRPRWPNPGRQPYSHQTHGGQTHND